MTLLIFPKLCVTKLNVARCLECTLLIHLIQQEKVYIVRRKVRVLIQFHISRMQTGVGMEKRPSTTFIAFIFNGLKAMDLGLKFDEIS